MSQTPSLGRVVHFRLPDRYPGDERWRPAVIVNVFGNLVNLTVFLDGLNDARDQDDMRLLQDAGVFCGMHSRVASVGSRAEGTDDGCWRWPPFVPPKPAPEAPIVMPPHEEKTPVTGIKLPFSVDG